MLAKANDAKINTNRINQRLNLKRSLQQGNSNSLQYLVLELSRLQMIHRGPNLTDAVRTTRVRAGPGLDELGYRD